MSTAFKVPIKLILCSISPSLQTLLNIDVLSNNPGMQGIVCNFLEPGVYNRGKGQLARKVQIGKLLKNNEPLCGWIKSDPEDLHNKFSWQLEISLNCKLECTTMCKIYFWGVYWPLKESMWSCRFEPYSLLVWRRKLDSVKLLSLSLYRWTTLSTRSKQAFEV